MSAYETMCDAIKAIMPTGWKFVGYEPLKDVPDSTSVTMKLRTVTKLPAAPLGAYEVDWVITITSGLPSRESADPSLFDDLLDFLVELDSTRDLAWLGWTEATKTVGDDYERLAYDITVRTHTKKEG